MSDIEKLRGEMEKITADMLRLLKSRTEIAKKIGSLKNEQGLTITDESREDDLRNKMLRICDEIGFDQSLAARFLNFLLNESVKINMLLDKGRQKYVTPLHPLQLPDAAAAAAAAAGAAADECEPHRPSSRLVPHRVERLGGRGRGRGRLVCLR